MDTLPYPNFNNYHDTIADASKVNIEGLLDGETSEVTVTNGTGNSQVTINFKNDGADGLKATDSQRSITITYTTVVDQDWLAASETYSWLQEHKNNVTFTGNDDSVDASATAIPIEQKINKYCSPWNNIKTGGTATSTGDGSYYYTYRLYLNGVNGDIEISDAFDTSIFELYDSSTKATGSEVELYVYGGDQYNQYQKSTVPMTITATSDGVKMSISGSDLATNNGVYYGYYRITYNLVVKKDALENLNEKAAEKGGNLSLGNTATWGSISDTADVTYSYDGIIKELLNKNELSGTNRTANYKITINKSAAKINDGEPYNITDTYNDSMSLNYSSIKIVDEEGNSVPEISYNAKGNTLTFYDIPDEKTVYITYSMRITGTGYISVNNTASFGDYSDSDGKSASFSSSGGGTASDAQINIMKVDSNLTSKKLPDAVFKLYLAEDDSEVQTTEVLKTDANGMLTLTGGTNGNVPTLQYDTKYYLVETVAPSGYEKSTIHYSFTIKEDWADIDYSSYIYGDDDTMQIRNTEGEQLGSLVITKTFDDDSDLTADDLTDAQKAAIKFTVTGPDDYSATNTYDKFEDGSWTLENLAAGEYTVTESGADVEDYTLTTTYSIEDGKVTVSNGDTAEIEVTNSYAQDLGSIELTKVTIGADTPADAEFTVTDADGNVVKTFKYSEFTMEKLLNTRTFRSANIQ